MTKPEYRDGLARLWRHARPNRLWRLHSDAVNAALIERWLPGSVESVLKTDLFDEAVSGGLYPALAARAEEVVGIDASAEVVRAAAARHSGLLVRQADIRSLPYEDESFDVVVSNSTLDHFSVEAEIVASLREIQRVLRPHGRLMLTLDNPSNPLNAIARALPLPHHVGETMGARRLREVLPSLGLDILAEEVIVHAPRALAVIFAELLERRADPRTQRRFLDSLAGLEQLSRWPTRYFTGHFVAVHAVKRP